ncbi:RNA polymerase sigma factor [Sphingomonas sp. OTU376]|uniref:RNA polymerase sigma factor n=1 Tax=Sphingomonas sp. OTU376 TaxID=3043863 RepID=UPI00313ED8C9
MSLDFASLSDGELAALSLAGRTAAFAEILQRHREAIYRIVAGSIGDPDEALDLVQETFLAAHGALRRYDPARPMRAWLTTIAINKCRDWGRRRAVRRLIAFALPIDDAAERVAEDRPGHDVEIADREALARTSRAIAGLPSSLREVIVLRTIEGLSQAETAAALGVSEKAVETRLRRARIRLGEVLGS